MQSNHLYFTNVNHYNFGDCLVTAATECPDKVAFIFQESTTRKSITYRELHLRALNVSIELRKAVAVGERALLVYPPGLDYIIGFMGCLYAGVIAVPVYPPATANAASKLKTIINDCEPSIILTDSQTKRRISQLRYANMATSVPIAGQFVTSLMRVSRSELTTMSDSLAIDIPFMPTDELPFKEKKLLGQSIIRSHRDSLAFLQYTSGSTGDPKGVMVSHGNLQHNIALLGKAHALQGGRAMYWLPPYHDMGLIGSILAPIYYSIESLLFSPIEFLRDPLKWVIALSEHKAHISAAPNFAYGLLVKRYDKARLDKHRIDLSNLRFLLNGAEPVRPSTIKQFNDLYAFYGLSALAMSPAYGLAEHTVCVALRGAIDPVLACDFDKASYARGHIIGTSIIENSMTFVASGPVFHENKVMIVNPETYKPLLQDQIGEIWVKSESVAKGYWNKPELTQQVFHAVTSIGEGPYLRTGDFGFIYEGQLFISGRLKDLIIIAGRNYYPQDIETVIEQANENVRPGCCIAFSAESNDTESLLLLVELREKGKQYSTEELSNIAQKITNHVFGNCGVMPEQVILLPEKTLDKTTSGKVRRQPNKQRYLKGELSFFYLHVQENAQKEGLSFELSHDSVTKEGLDITDYLLRPVSKTEERIQVIWAKVLGRDISDINRGDNFIRLGGQSLLIVQLQQIVFEQFGVELPVSFIFEDKNLAMFASVVEELVKEAPLSAYSMAINDDSEPLMLPLSAGQERFWFLDQSLDGRNSYNEFLCFEIEGAFDSEALGEALAVISQRHSSLRTSYLVLDNGSVVQRMQPKILPIYEVVALSNEPIHTNIVDKAIEDFTATPFDLCEAPLWRTQLIQCAEAQFVCTIVFHHSIFDGISARCFVPELFFLYKMAENGTLGDVSLPKAFQYFEYSQWENTWKKSSAFDVQIKYWKERFEGFEPPPAIPRKITVSEKERVTQGANQGFEIPTELHQSIQAFCRGKGVTPYTFYLTTFYILLSRYMQSQDIVVGTATANRYLPGSLSGIGYFVNTIPLRQWIDVNKSFDELLTEVWKNNCADFANTQLPFDEILKQSPLRTNLFETFFVYQGDIDNMLSDEGTDLSVKRYNNVHSPKGTAKFNMTLELIGVENHLEASVEYRCDVYSADFITRLFQHYHVLLSNFLEQAPVPIKEINMLSTEEIQQQLATWNDTERPYSDTTIHELFEVQVKRTPDAIALVYEDQEMTYRELNIRANQVAHYLRKQGIGSQPQGNLMKIRLTLPFLANFCPKRTFF